MLKLVPDALISLLYPQACAICRQSVENSADGVACHDCWKKTKIFSDRDTLCSKCGTFLREFDRLIETVCRRCNDHLYDSARAAGPYENALSAVVVHLKHAPSISKTPRKHLIEALGRHFIGNTDLIVPVPLSKKRLFDRGFNQAAVLALILAKESGIALDDHSLIRTVHTQMHRAAMDRKAREMTVKNAFSVIRPKLIAGKRVLLIDDVFTSGSTASQCAKVLKKNGAGSVNVLTLARVAWSNQTFY